MNKPPFKMEHGRITSEQDEGEIWVKNEDSVLEIGRRIWFAWQARETKPWPFVDVAAIGRSSMGVAIAGVAAAREYLHKEGADLRVVPYWSEYTNEQDHERSRLMIRIFWE